MPETSILIVGGGCGAVAAALAIARTGGTCILTEYTDWVGGQLTSQAVPPDENRWIEGEDGFFGATASYIDFRNKVRASYRQNRRLTTAAMESPRLNPGNGWVSHLCMEPRIAHDVLLALLAPYVASGAVKILLNIEPVSASTSGDRVTSVTFKHRFSSETTTISADYFLDATELGDLYPLAGIEYMSGAEAQSVFGEMHARKEKSDPSEYQAISWCFAIEHKPGENHTIAKPQSYEFWRGFTPRLDHPWPGRLFSWTVLGGDKHEPREFRFLPWPQQPDEHELEMWRYRRIVDRSIYDESIAANHPDVALINMVQMDYFLKPIVDVSPQAKLQAMNEAKDQSLAFLYWMQTEAPRYDGTDGVGFPGLKLRGDELGTADGFAKFPYIREGRRLKARTIVTEAHIGTDQRRAENRPNQHAKPWGLAHAFPDSVGIGHYRLDLHPSTAMRNSIYVQSAPFRIPLGSLIPIRVRNVLAAAKNQGVTHITNGCYRMHPTEWNTGESAGLLAQHCIATNREPAQIHEDSKLVQEFQALVMRQGIPIAWRWEN
jgi:hypothetical protein